MNQIANSLLWLMPIFQPSNFVTLHSENRIDLCHQQASSITFHLLSLFIFSHTLYFVIFHSFSQLIIWHIEQCWDIIFGQILSVVTFHRFSPFIVATFQLLSYFIFYHIKLICFTLYMLAHCVFCQILYFVTIHFCHISFVITLYNLSYFFFVTFSFKSYFIHCHLSSFVTLQLL